MRRYSKIKWHPENGVFLEFQEQRPDKTWDDHTMRTDDPPSDEMASAFAALVPLALDLCEIRPSEKNPVEVRGVSITRADDGTEGVTVTSLRKLQSCAAPLVLNTPHQPLADLPELAEALQELFAAADSFYHGRRIQTDLFEAAQLVGAGT